MKRTWILALAVLMLVFAPNMLLRAEAAEIVASGTCGENLTWILDSDGLLTISGSGSMKDYSSSSSVPWYSRRESILSIVVEEGVTSISESAFESCGSLTSITLPNSIASIGNNAFTLCVNLRSITIPAGVTSIGSSAFSGCTSLSSITIPDSVTTIRNCAFYGCTSLSSITIPECVTDIGLGVFDGCTNLNSIWVDNKNPICSSDDYGVLFDKNKKQLLRVPSAIAGSYSIPESVIEIGYDAFRECTNLSSITIPDSVVSIDRDAFNGCDSLSSITIPDSVTTIGDNAFSDCASLSSITIPESVTSIGEDVFGGCTNLTGIWVDNKNLVYSNDDYGVLFDKKKSQLLRAPETIVGLYSVPTSVTEIGAFAFAGCRSLIGITIPEGVIKIDYAAFADTGLRSIMFPESITCIEGNVFGNCTSLSNITIPEGITRIYSDTFHDCDSLTSITIPEGVISISGYVFYDCMSLSSITLPESVTLIGVEAFYGCENLSTIHYGGTQEQQTELTVHPGNECLNGATWHYECDGVVCKSPPPTEPEATNPEAPEPKPTEPKPTEPEETPVPENPFVDVFREDYYYDPVLWAVNKGITNGMDDTHFAPADICSRGQVVTFLWRANGSPEPETGYNPFRDVKMTDYFYEAVLWAVENGITSGVSADSFAPGAACTRGQVATFLWRSQGKPSSAAENIFTDIAAGAYYYDAVLWAVENGITNGMGEGIFAPDATCTRGQIVTFLYRAMK